MGGSVERRQLIGGMAAGSLALTSVTARARAGAQTGAGPAGPIFHIDDFGAVSVPWGAPVPPASVQAKNRLAIQYAIEFVAALQTQTGTLGFTVDPAPLALPPELQPGQRSLGGELVFGTGVYYVNDWVGVDTCSDVNVGLTISGLGNLPSLLATTNNAEPLFKFHTEPSSGAANLRSFAIRDIALAGGSHCLSMVHCAYNEITGVKFWGGPGLDRLSR